MRTVARRGCLTSSLRCLRHCTGSTSVRPVSRSFSGSSVAASMRRLSRTLLASSPMLLPLRFCAQSRFFRPFPPDAAGDYANQTVDVPAPTLVPGSFVASRTRRCTNSLPPYVAATPVLHQQNPCHIPWSQIATEGCGKQSTAAPLILCSHS